MIYNSNFEHDLAIGQLTEKFIGNLLSNKKVEVKHDFKALTTGNVFIEYESRGKPSGISTSKADYYCIVFSKVKFIFIELEALKEIAREYKHKTVTGGDSNTSKGILIPNCKLI